MTRHDASGWEIKHCPHCPILSLQIVRTCDLGSFLHSDTTLRSWSSLCGASSADGSVAPIESSDLVGFVILGESRTKSGPKIWLQLKWILTICKRNFAGLLFWSLIWSILHIVPQGRLFIVETLLFNAFSTFQQKESVETVGFRANQAKKIHRCTFPFGQPSCHIKSLPKSGCIGPGCTREGSRKPGPGIVGMPQKRGDYLKIVEGIPDSWAKKWVPKFVSYFWDAPNYFE